MLRYLFIKLFTILTSIKVLNASFCGESSLPYYLKVSPENELILGCVKPTCLNFLPGASSHFTSLQDGYYDGFKAVSKNSKNSLNVTEKIECDEQFGATKCVKDGEWVGGIHPSRSEEEAGTDDSEKRLSFRCCRNSAMKKAKFQKAFDLKANEEFKRGGDVYEKGKLIGFDYISNIIKFENEEGTNYELFVTRVLCNKNENSLKFTTTNETVQPAFDQDGLQKQKLYQALLVEAENPNAVNNANSNELQNLNAQPENGAGAGAGANPICSNAQIITNSGRGTDLPITQTGTSSITVTCTSGTPNAPIALNYFQQTADRGVTNGFGTVSQTLDCNANGQLTLPPMPNLPNPVVVDQVECITPSVPPPPPLQQLQAPVQFIPQQQPVFSPAAT